MLPLILPGVLSGAAFAFVASFDELVIALFLAGPNSAPCRCRCSWACANT